MRSSMETWPRRPWRSLSGIMTLENPMISSVRNTREMLLSRVPVLGRCGPKNRLSLVSRTSDTLQTALMWQKTGPEREGGLGRAHSSLWGTWSDRHVALNSEPR